MPIWHIIPTTKTPNPHPAKPHSIIQHTPASKHHLTQFVHDSEAEAEAEVLLQLLQMENPRSNFCHKLSNQRPHEGEGPYLKRHPKLQLETTPQKDLSFLLLLLLSGDDFWQFIDCLILSNF